MTTETPNDFEGALAYCRQQHVNRDVPSYYGQPTWEGLCQAFCHEAYGLHTGGFASAWLQWCGLDAEDRHATTDLSHAPLGALLFSKGVSAYGHIYIAARPFKSDGSPAAQSTDLWKTGEVGKVARNAPVAAWGHRILGWGTSINGYALDLTHTYAAAKPKQNKRYQRIENAILNLHEALPAARADHDVHDVEAIQKEIKRLQALYSKIKHS